MPSAEASLDTRALESLLADSDVSTVNLTVQALLVSRERHERLIQHLAECENRMARKRARDILAKWMEEDEASRPPLVLTELDLSSWSSLEEFCWFLSEQEERGFSREDGKSVLDSWARRIRQRLSLPHPSDREVHLAFQHVLSREEGLKGNTENYYDPANSYLHHVLQTGLGIPLSLCLIYIFVGQRLHLNVRGLNTPGHYLVMVGALVFDPFYAGVELGPAQLSERFGHTASDWADPSCLIASPVSTTQRMLTNLVNSYKRNGDQKRLDRMITYLRLLQELPS